MNDIIANAYFKGGFRMTEIQKQKKAPENKMGIMPVPKLLITMSLPMMLSMLVGNWSHW